MAALGTFPLPVEPQPLRTSRYERMAELFGLTAHEQLTCGCHVHVGISSAEEGVAVLDRAGPWLATLLALSANSPFWQGRDSEYASFRYQVWGRWPSSGPAEPFGTARAYRETIEQMVASGTLIDPGMVYFDARLSERYPHHRDPHRRCVPARRGRRAHRRAGPSAGGNRGPVLAGRKAGPAGADRVAAPGGLAGQPVRPG